MYDFLHINDVRVSPYSLKRKHLVELLIIEDKIKDKNTGKIIEKKTLHYHKEYIKIIS